MKLYWNEKKQQLYCVGLYSNNLNEGFMKLSTNKEEKLDDEVVSTFISKYDDIVGKYETSDHIFYGDLDVLITNGKLDDTQCIFFEFLKESKR